MGAKVLIAYQRQAYRYLTVLMTT